MVNSKNKGSRVEREIAKQLGGRRTLMSGATDLEKGDVKALGLQIEVKARKDGFKQLYQWLEGNDALVVKADRKEALIVIPISKFKELINDDSAREI